MREGEAQSTKNKYTIAVVPLAENDDVKSET